MSCSSHSVENGGGSSLQGQCGVGLPLHPAFPFPGYPLYPGNILAAAAALRQPRALLSHLHRGIQDKRKSFTIDAILGSAVNPCQSGDNPGRESPISGDPEDMSSQSRGPLTAGRLVGSPYTTPPRPADLRSCPNALRYHGDVTHTQTSGRYKQRIIKVCSCVYFIASSYM